MSLFDVRGPGNPRCRWVVDRFTPGGRLRGECTEIIHGRRSSDFPDINALRIRAFPVPSLRSASSGTTPNYIGKSSDTTTARPTQTWVSARARSLNGWRRSRGERGHSLHCS
eukprot:3973547-Pyramimonas_sp.AAC.1